MNFANPIKGAKRYHWIELNQARPELRDPFNIIKLYTEIVKLQSQKQDSMNNLNYILLYILFLELNQ
jgi:hypothetical protein